MPKFCDFGKEIKKKLGKSLPGGLPEPDVPQKFHCKSDCMAGTVPLPTDFLQSINNRLFDSGCSFPGDERKTGKIRTGGKGR